MLDSIRKSLLHSETLTGLRYIILKFIFIILFCIQCVHKVTHIHLLLANYRIILKIPETGRFLILSCFVININLLDRVNYLSLMTSLLFFKHPILFSKFRIFIAELIHQMYQMLLQICIGWAKVQNTIKYFQNRSIIWF